jgi:hypothetical protein
MIFGLIVGINLLSDQCEVRMINAIIDFIRSLFHMKPRPKPFRGTAKLTWIKPKGDDKEVKKQDK